MYTTAERPPSGSRSILGSLQKYRHLLAAIYLLAGAVSAIVAIVDQTDPGVIALAVTGIALMLIPSGTYIAVGRVRHLHSRPRGVCLVAPIVIAALSLDLTLVGICLTMSELLNRDVRVVLMIGVGLGAVGLPVFLWCLWRLSRDWSTWRVLWGLPMIWLTVAILQGIFAILAMLYLGTNRGEFFSGLLCAFAAGAAGAVVTSGLGIEIALLYLRGQALNETNASMQIE
jgi:hypothetical protein